MVETSNDVIERLCLQRDPSGDVSVPCYDLAQHQIDGVRFLFSQYKKEKLGVILNFPPGCGNSVQTAVFISAICQKQKKPALILYDSDQEKEAWLARFTKWTSIGVDSIEIDTPNTYVRKQIFLKNVADVAKFYRRSWGIVVVKSDSFMKIFRKCQLKADFKIWLTAQDLKKDRELLRSVYTWINPSDQLLQEYLDRKSPTLFKEDATNEILLDLLLEDILFSRISLKPFGTHKRKLDIEIQPILRVTKKNKDATGTKIKRSKKYREVCSTSTVHIENVTSLNENYNATETNVFPAIFRSGEVTNMFRMEPKKPDKDDEESKMDVETFIRDNDPLKSDMNLNFGIRNLDNISQLSEVSIPKAEEAYTESSLDFSTAVAEIIRHENNIPTEICENAASHNAKIVEKVTDLTQDENDTDIEEKDSTELNRIDLSKPFIQKVFFVSSQDKRSVESDLDDKKKDAEKTEKKSLEEGRNGVADQKSKLDISSVMNETDGSFESKVKKLEEQALRKFKGSVLDNLFKC